MLTNDDGLHAPGLEALRGAAEGLGELSVIAPVGPRSGCGHTVTTHAPILIHRIEDGRFAVEGTPADCTRMALHHLAPKADWVLSGINAGGNLGADVYHSGTVAAAREAALRGKPAIAFSHYVAKGRAIDWPRAAGWARRVLVELLARPCPAGAFWNINLPHPEPGPFEPKLVICPLDPSPLPLNYQVSDGLALYDGDYHSRARRPGADVAVCFGGQIAATLIRMVPEGAGLVEDGPKSS